MEHMEMVKKALKKSGKLLLPIYFRWIGVAVILLSVIIPLLLKYIHPEILKSSGQTGKMILMSLVNLGLFLMAASRFKNENEMTWNIRFRSLVFACVLGITQVILEPLKDYLTGQNIEDSTSQGLVLMMLLVYHLFFFLQKKALKRSGA